MSKYKLCRGFKDLMPSDYKKYLFLKDTIEEVSNVYGYKMLKSSCIEVVMRNCSSIPENLFQCIWLEKHSRISQLISVLSISNSLILIILKLCHICDIYGTLIFLFLLRAKR